MQNAVAVRPSNELMPTRSSIPTDHEMMVYQTMAEQAVSSKMYKGIGEKAGVMMIMLAARELGIPPMQALNGGINIINGKVEVSARMMSALIRKAGHQLVVKECSESQCILQGKRCDTGESQISSFSIAEAQKAGLVKQGGGWTKFPKDMCFARALSRLARQLFSDVIGIGYVEGEIKAIEADVMVDHSQDIQEVYPSTDKTEQEWLEEYLNMFIDQEDKYYAQEYLKVVGAHFEWSRLQTIQELLKDPTRLFEKYKMWKDRIKKADSPTCEGGS